MRSPGIRSKFGPGIEMVTAKNQKFHLRGQAPKLKFHFFQFRCLTPKVKLWVVLGHEADA